MIPYEQIDKDGKKPLFIHCGHQANGRYDCKMKIIKGTVLQHWSEYHREETSK